MKTLVLFFFTCFLSHSLHAEVNISTEKAKIVVVVIYDLSKSTDSYIMLNSKHLENIYYGMGQNGGGKFYGLHIQTNSAEQNPVMAEVAPLNLLPLKGNAYQKANIENRNKKLSAEFETGKNSFITDISKQLILLKKHDFSDLKNALELARKIMENPFYVNYDKKLIIISDMENDLPPKQGIDRMSTVIFENGLNIVLVRPSDKVKISQILIGKTSIYVTIEDAVQSLFNLK